MVSGRKTKRMNDRPSNTRDRFGTCSLEFFFLPLLYFFVKNLIQRISCRSFCGWKMAHSVQAFVGNDAQCKSFRCSNLWWMHLQVSTKNLLFGARIRFFPALWISFVLCERQTNKCTLHSFRINFMEEFYCRLATFLCLVYVRIINLVLSSSLRSTPQKNANEKKAHPFRVIRDNEWHKIKQIILCYQFLGARSMTLLVVSISHCCDFSVVHCYTNTIFIYFFFRYSSSAKSATRFLLNLVNSGDSLFQLFRFFCCAVPPYWMSFKRKICLVVLTS